MENYEIKEIKKHQKLFIEEKDGRNTMWNN